MQYTLTHESIIVVVNERTHMVRRGSPNFNALRTAILTESWDDIPRHLSVGQSLARWAGGRFSVQQSCGGERILFDGRELPAELNGRIVEMATNGEDPSALFRFWERLQRNPSKRSVDQLWQFLNHQGIPLTPDGTFLAYKSVREDYRDHYSGEYDNTPGNINEMPRNQISDDPNHACHEGFHVGALEYARSFGNEDRRIVICEVDPADVVCVPYDSSAQKMRVSKYKVVGNHGGDFLSSTTHTEELPLTACHKKEEVERAPVTIEDTIASMTMKQLMDVPIAALRSYAYRGLGIVGASKIPGGKVALINAILRVRRRGSR